jgi:hypothetical protein
MNQLQTTLCLSLAVFLTACSSNNGSNDPAAGNTSVADDSGATTGDGTEADGTSKPDGSVAFSCSNSQSFSIPPSPDTTATSSTAANESGSEGDILFDCKTHRFSLTPGISSLNISDLQKRLDVDFSCPDGKEAKGNITFNYKTGEVTQTGSLNGQSASCTTTFISPLEAVISDAPSIRNLLVAWGNDDSDPSVISSTCPDDKNNLSDSFDQFNCSGTVSNNYTITDHNGKIHKLSTKDTYTIQ